MVMVEMNHVISVLQPKLSSDLALKRAGLTYKDMSYAEINEAFSCTALSNM